jgi:hypothetical protein
VMPRPLPASWATNAACARMRIGPSNGRIFRHGEREMKAATLTVLAMLSAVSTVGVAAQPAEGNSDHQQMLARSGTICCFAARNRLH